MFLGIEQLILRQTSGAFSVKKLASINQYCRLHMALSCHRRPERQARAASSGDCGYRKRDNRASAGHKWTVHRVQRLADIS